MSREGRSQPVQPSAWHGFVDPGPGPVGTTPAQPIVVENLDDRRRKTPPVQPIVVSGVYATVLAPAVVMPPQSLAVGVEARRLQVVPAIQISGVLATTFVGPTAGPPAPTVVPLNERRWVTQQPTVNRGFDDVMPPQPEVILSEGRRGLVLAPIVVSGALAPFFPPFVAPPKPLVVFFDGKRLLVPQPVVLAGPAFPTGVVGAIYTQQFGGPHPGEAGLVGAPSGGFFGPPSPSRA